MRCSTTCAYVISGLALLSAGSSARADFIKWHFSTAVTPQLVHSNNHHFGWVHLTATGGVAFGSTQLVLANLFSVSGALGPAAPDAYSRRPFKITLSITDMASNVTGKAIFNGLIDGSASLFGSLLKIHLTSPPQQRLHLGRHIYDIKLDTITPPGPPNGPTIGSFGATVLVSHNPEPASVVLAGVGALTLGLAAWRRRRRLASPGDPAA